jgi:hypothetical protein
LTTLEIELSYIGAEADEHELDFYDASVALIGFQRSLAITTHLILNGEVITQAPALKGARILALPPEEGSWKIKAAVFFSAAATAVFQLGTAPKDTPIGNLVRSAYDFVISESLGFHVDYQKTLGEQYDEIHRHGSLIQKVQKSQLESVIEKTHVAVRDMHRPMVFSETATKATLKSRLGREQHPLAPPLTRITYEYMNVGVPVLGPNSFVGWVSSYNMNTFKGRIYLEASARPIPFELQYAARTPKNINAIAKSLTENIKSRKSELGKITFSAVAIESKTGRLTLLLIEDILE